MGCPAVEQPKSADDRQAIKAIHATFEKVIGNL
jgi:hypothetical protein